MSNFAPELSGKLLELTKETIPKASRIAVFAHSSSPNWKLYFKQMDGTARSLAVQLLAFQIREPDEIESSFATARSTRADVLIVPRSAFLHLYRQRIIALATENHLPAIGFAATWAEEDCLLSYGPSTAEFNRRAAYYVDKILNGAKPADLPVEQPTKFELVINLKTAKQIGFMIPPNVLARADRVIRYSDFRVPINQWRTRHEREHYCFGRVWVGPNIFSSRARNLRRQCSTYYLRPDMSLSLREGRITSDR